MSDKLYAGYSINTTLSLLDNFKNTLTEKSDLIKAKNRFATDMSLIKKMTQELILIIRVSYASVCKTDMQELLNTINEQASKVSSIENHVDLISSINKLMRFKDLEWSSLDTVDCYDVIRHLAVNTHCTCENMNNSDVAQLIAHLNINREFSVFSPRCSNGDTFELIKSLSNDKAITYGLEERNTLSTEAKTKMDRVIKGQITGSKISNDIFDIMVLTPRVSWEAKYGVTGNLIEKMEKSTLRNTIKFLKDEGILVFNIPHTRLTKDMAFVMSKLLKNVQVIRKHVDDLYITIVGVIDVSKDSRQDVYSYLSDLTLDKIGRTLTSTYNLPPGGLKTPEFFRGSILDEEELQSLINSSGLMDSFWSKTETKKDNEGARPLLPFNMGQVGLVLTSGCLDGVIEEYEGQYHAIKGMVTKIKHTDNNREGSDETSVETISNKVQINIMTPNGDFIELA